MNNNTLKIISQKIYSFYIHTQGTSSYRRINGYGWPQEIAGKFVAESCGIIRLLFLTKTLFIIMTINIVQI